MSRAKDKGKKFVFEEWNELLPKQASDFVGSHPGTTALVYSSYDTFVRVLDNPTEYGLESDDVSRHGGGIWCDHLHPTSKMHNEVAKDLLVFLSDIAPKVADS